MAIHGPDAASRSSGPSRHETLHVAGVALGRFRMVDGRPPDSLAEVGEMILHFRPGTVPLLSKHSAKDGKRLGYLNTLQADDRDLHFTATIEVTEARADHLRRNGSPVSIETVTTLYPRLDGRPHTDAMTEPMSSTHPHWRGRIHYGTNLVGVAMSTNPASRMSVLWVPLET